MSCYTVVNKGVIYVPLSVEEYLKSLEQETPVCVSHIRVKCQNSKIIYLEKQYCPDVIKDKVMEVLKKMLNEDINHFDVLLHKCERDENEHYNKQEITAYHFTNKIVDGKSTDNSKFVDVYDVALISSNEVMHHPV